MHSSQLVDVVIDDDPRSEGIEDAKPLLFDLNEIRAATDSFSDANKLGEGGFGAVYKVHVSLIQIIPYFWAAYMEYFFTKLVLGRGSCQMGKK